MSSNNLKEIWDLTLTELENEYKNTGKEKYFQLWFNLKYVEDDDFKIKVSVPSEFMWNHMNSKGIITEIKKELKKITGQNIELESIVDKDEIKKSIESETKINIQQPEIKKESIKIDNSQKNNKNTSDTLFEEKYTFENFITGEGSSSKFAYNVAYSIAENPGTKQNPVLLYGGVGLGKTHLMKAIGNKIHELFPEKKICYIQSEPFLNEFIKSNLNKTQDTFKSKYRKLDVLLLDDIHFLHNKPAIQEELFYTFEALKEKKAQMVFTCDRPIKEVEDMTDRLISRIGSGINLNLDFPSYEIRKAIIYKKLENEKKQLPEEIIDFIARIIETNIRDLESALSNVTGYAEFLDSPITLEIAQQQLQNFYSSPKTGNISVQNIMKTVAKNYEITVEEMKSSKRQQKFVNPRHIALFICHELTEYTYTELGNEFGGRDHSSIMHAVEKVEEKLKTDPNLKQTINFLIKEIKEGK